MSRIPPGAPTAATCAVSFALLTAFSAGCRKDMDPSTGAAPNPSAEVESARMAAGAVAAALGQKVTTGYFEVTAFDGRNCNVEPSQRPRDGLERWGIELEIRATSAADIPVSAFYATLRDGSGQRYESVLSGCTPLLPARTLRDGQRVRGWVSFDVPQGAHDLELAFEPNLLGVGRVRSAHQGGR